MLLRRTIPIAAKFGKIPMGRTRIVLSGLSHSLAGLSWETDRVLRIGRQNNLEVVLRDFSVDRMHAEVRVAGGRWILRDLARNPLYPTLVNREPVDNDRPLGADDVIQLGKLMLRVTAVEAAEIRGIYPPPAPASPAAPAAAPGDQQIRASGLHVRVQVATSRSWDEAVDAVARERPAATAPTPVVTSGDGLLRQNQQLSAGLRTLLRANQHLSRLADLDELLHSILADAVGIFAAQRGSIILADPVTGELRARALYSPGLPPLRTGLAYSRTLIDRCFRLGESLLCRDVQGDTALQQAQSIQRGTMSSIICALLRSPRQRLGVLHLDRGPMQEPFSRSDLDLADALAASVAVGIESAQLIEQHRQQFIDTVQTLARAVEMRDQYTGEHTRRVTDYALLLAEELRLGATERYQLQVGTPLHDIGKIGIDDAILRKPGKLTEAEFEAMKTHTTKGASMLVSLLNLAPMIPIVKYHHERVDGKGYPDGLHGERIPLSARIVAVADSFDAMTSDRPYRPALPAEVAFLELVRTAGSHFDPRCVEAFLRARTRVEALLRGE
jgi:HD-GYP domain-containing protein (c-di-GMP phosphodiesterase class II)